MNCHKIIWNEAPMLEPVRESYRTGRPIAWERVHDLPDFAYFNHAIHVQRGVGCASCHGRVDQMPLMWQTGELTMSWCLDCHRNPTPHLRPRDKVFDMAWEPPPDQDKVGAELAQAVLDTELLLLEARPLDLLAGCQREVGFELGQSFLQLAVFGTEPVDLGFQLACALGILHQGPPFQGPAGGWPPSFNRTSGRAPRNTKPDLPVSVSRGCRDGVA